MRLSTSLLASLNAKWELTRAFKLEEINALTPSRMINAYIKRYSPRLNITDAEEYKKFIIHQCENSEHLMYPRLCSLSK